MTAYSTLYKVWTTQTTPTPVAARMTRRTLEYLASGLGAADWQACAALPESDALVLLDAAMAQTNLNSQSRSNYRGYLRRLYRFAAEAGIELTNGDPQHLWPAISTEATVPRRAQVAYDRFVQWAIGQRIWPGTITAASVLDWALQEKSRRNAHWRKDYVRLQEAWGALNGRLPAISFPPLPAALNARYGVPMSDWPSHLREQWAAICREASSPLRKGGLRAWQPITRDLYEQRLGRYLGWLSQTSPALNLETETWATLLSPDRCRDYLNWLVARTGKADLNPGHPAFLRAIRGFHRFLLGSGPEIIEAFYELTRRCEVQERDKAMRLLPYPDLQSALRMLLDALSSARKTRQREAADPIRLANRQVDALILGLLVTRALRSLNIREMKLGTNLVEQDSGYALRFDGHEMKGHRRFDTTVPDELALILRDYLRHGYRALSGRSPGDGDPVLLNRRGKPFNAGFGARVRRIAQRYIGQPINPHLFRHILATHAAQDLHMTPPELAALLAHRSSQTCMKYYEVTNATLAAARLDACRQAG